MRGEMGPDRKTNDSILRTRYIKERWPFPRRGHADRAHAPKVGAAAATFSAGNTLLRVEYLDGSTVRYITFDPGSMFVEESGDVPAVPPLARTGASDGERCKTSVQVCRLIADLAGRWK